MVEMREARKYIEPESTKSTKTAYAQQDINVKGSIHDNHNPVSDSESCGSKMEEKKKGKNEDLGTLSDKSSSSSPDQLSSKHMTSDSSRLFVPHRTVGIVTSGKGFSYNNAGNETFLSVPIGSRFQMFKCDKLTPVLVSEMLPLPQNARSNKFSSSTPQKMEMYQIVSDPSLQISLATYGRSNGGRCTNIALYDRDKVKKSLDVFLELQLSERRKMSIVQMIKLGKLKLQIDDESNEHIEVRGEAKSESCLLVALICASFQDFKDSLSYSQKTFVNGVRESDSDSDAKTHKKKKNVKIVGESSSDEQSSESDSESDSDEESEFDQEAKGNGHVIIVAATKSKLRIWNQMPIITKPPNSNFHPTCSCSPTTYINKIVVGGAEGRLVLLNIRTRKLIYEFKCCLPPNFTLESRQQIKNSLWKYGITVLEQSPAVDTLAVGTSGGSVHLINIKYDTKLFTLSHSRGKIVSLSFRTDSSAASAGIAPLAVGNVNGTISLWDLTDQSSSSSFNSEDDVPKSSTSFTGKRRLLYNMTQCHPGGLAHFTFLPFEPILITSGSKDNSIKMHIFDAPDFTSRVLRSRCGHFAPPRFIRYLHGGTGGNGGLILANQADGTDAASCQILSAAMGHHRYRDLEDRTLRVFSTVRSVLDKEYSQGKGLEQRAKSLGVRKADLLLPEIIMFATCETRSRDWGDLVTIHKNHAHAYVWSNRRGAQSGPVLRQNSWHISAMKVPPPAACHATSVTISSCGNFAIVGTRGGVIYKYNMQSGLPRGSYPPGATEEDENLKKKSKLAGSIKRSINAFEKETKMDMPFNLDRKEQEEKESYSKLEKAKRERKNRARHINSTVVGVAVDSLNRSLISAGTDGKLIVWSFTGHSPHRKSPFILSCGATKLCHIRDNDLAAVALEDFSILIFDCSALSIVRRFGGSRSGKSVFGHSGPVSDLGFGPDGRRLFSSSLDGSIRVWDVPTGSCVDWLSFPAPPTSLTLSATGEFLATTHVGQLGINLWCDKSFFQTVFLDGQFMEKPAFMESPRPIAEQMDKVDLNAESNIRKVENSSIFEASKDTANMKQEQKSLFSSDVKVVAKADKLVTMSGLPPSHWKTLFHLELVRERNKPKEPPKKPPTAPFFLQWRGGDFDAVPDETDDKKKNLEVEKEDEDETWDAAWSDDDEEIKTEADHTIDSKEDESKGVMQHKRSIAEPTLGKDNGTLLVPKKRKVAHVRSHLAGLLEECFSSSNNRMRNDVKNIKGSSLFGPVTQYMATMGPSAVDVELSTLCHGTHDLEEGLPLLQLSSLWLLEACQTRQSFEAINAYLNRFLSIHSRLIAGIEEDIDDHTIREEKDRDDIHEQKLKLLGTVGKLREVQTEASESLRGKMQHTLCLLKHFSRMI